MVGTFQFIKNLNFHGERSHFPESLDLELEGRGREGFIMKSDFKNSSLFL